MSYAKKALFNSFYIFIFSILGTGLGYFLRIFLAKNMTPTDFGLFYAVWAMFMSLYVLKDLGLNEALIKFLPRYYLNDKNNLNLFSSTILWTKLTLSILISTALIFFISPLSNYYFKNEKAPIFIFIFIFYFILSTLLDIASSLMTGFQNPELAAFLSFLDKAIFFLITLILFYTGFNEFSAPIALLLSATIIGILGLMIMKKKGISFGFSYNLNMLKESLHFGFPLIFAGLGGFLIGYFDVLMLTYYSTLEIVGIYSSVLATTMVFGFFGGAISSVVFPSVSEAVEKKNYDMISKGINLSHKYILMFVNPIILSFFMFSELTLKTLFSESFITGSIAFQILLLGVIFLNIAIVNLAFLNGMGFSKITGKTYFIAASANIAMNLLLIPAYGMNGAAISTLVSYLIMLLYSTYHLVDNKKIILDLRFIGIIFLGSSIFSISLLSLKYFFTITSLIWAIPAVILSFMIYLITLFLFRILDFKEITDILMKK